MWSCSLAHTHILEGRVAWVLFHSTEIDVFHLNLVFLGSCLLNAVLLYSRWCVNGHTHPHTHISSSRGDNNTAHKPDLRPFFSRRMGQIDCNMVKLYPLSPSPPLPPSHKNIISGHFHRYKRSSDHNAIKKTHSGNIHNEAVVLRNTRIGWSSRAETYVYWWMN